jgi:Holliday junction resolvase RusA-like endonuclease
MSTLPFPGKELKRLNFTVFARPEPQGSMKGFVIPGKGGRKPRAILTSDNKKLKPYRQELTNTATQELVDLGIQAPFAGKHVPVRLSCKFYLEKPASVAKKRERLVVKPDLSKLIRSTEDALTGIMYADDAQIVEGEYAKLYSTPERVEIWVQILD